MKKKPNILFLMTDQQRFDSLRCYGNEVMDTPNLDWIANEGCLFKNAYTPSPSCIPARASLITGMNTWDTGILGMGKGQGPMGVGFTHTLPGELGKQGYHTQGIGKMHFYPQRSLNGFHNTIIDESGREEHPHFISDYKKWFNKNKNGDYGINDHGINWNSWIARPYHAPEYLHPTNWTTNTALDFIEEKDPSKPFFLMVSYARPHSPYDALPYYFDLYMDRPLPEAWCGDWCDKHDHQTDRYHHDAWHGKRSKEEIHRARAGYYGSITHIDHQIGRIITELRKSGELDSTIIVFTSDHGDMLGDHHLWRKTYAYEGSSHIPLLIRIPKLLQESYPTLVSEISHYATLEDLMPTLLQLCDVPIPEQVTGKSLLPCITNNAPVHDFIHGEHTECYSADEEMQFIVKDGFKYIWLPRIGEEELFDLNQDPKELMNLAQNSEYNELLMDMREKMIDIFKDRGMDIGSKKQLYKWEDTLQSPHYKERILNSSLDESEKEKILANL